MERMHLTLFEAVFDCADAQLIKVLEFRHSNPNKYKTVIFSLKIKGPVVARRIRCLSILEWIGGRALVGLDGTHAFLRFLSLL